MNVLLDSKIYQDSAYYSFEAQFNLMQKDNSKDHHISWKLKDENTSTWVYEVDESKNELKK